MQGKMMAYDRVVVELNAARLRGASFPVVHAFIQAALSLNPDVSTFDDSTKRSFPFTLL
jgi:nuclear pore complex protein Nup93